MSQETATEEEEVVELTDDERAQARRLFPAAEALSGAFQRRFADRASGAIRQIPNVVEHLRNIERRYGDRIRRCRNSPGMHEEVLEMIQRIMPELADNHAMQTLNTELEAIRSPHYLRMVDMTEIMGELIALEQEFSEQPLVWTPRGEKLTARTGPITLEHRGRSVMLGRFDIILKISGICESGSRAYSINSIDPCRPSEGRGTHPHVQDHQLCEGDGGGAIRVCLDRGAIHEFFVLIRQILQTYNDNSPYTALRYFPAIGEEGSPLPEHTCGNCDERYTDAERASCNACEEASCIDCTTLCRHCGATFCHGCRERRQENGEPYSPDCGRENCCLFQTASCQACRQQTTMEPAVCSARNLRICQPCQNTATEATAACQVWNGRRRVACDQYRTSGCLFVQQGQVDVLEPENDGGSGVDTPPAADEAGS